MSSHRSAHHLELFRERWCRARNRAAEQRSGRSGELRAPREEIAAVRMAGRRNSHLTNAHHAKFETPNLHEPRQPPPRPQTRLSAQMNHILADVKQYQKDRTPLLHLWWPVRRLSRMRTNLRAPVETTTTMKRAGPSRRSTRSSPRATTCSTNNNTNDALAAAVASLLAEAKAQRGRGGAQCGSCGGASAAAQRLGLAVGPPAPARHARRDVRRVGGGGARGRAREADEAAEERIERRMRQWRLASSSSLRRWEANKEILGARRSRSSPSSDTFVLLVWDGWLTSSAGPRAPPPPRDTAVRALGRVLHTCFLGGENSTARAIRTAAVAAAVPLRRPRRRRVAAEPPRAHGAAARAAEAAARIGFGGARRPPARRRGGAMRREARAASKAAREAQRRVATTQAATVEGAKATRLRSAPSGRRRSLSSDAAECGG